MSTRVMLVGREHLERPDGSLVLAGDSDAHLTYFSTKGTCTLHDEFYVPPPTLPGEEPMPGDPDFQWPIGPWDPGEVLPPDGSQIANPDPGPDPIPDPDPVEPTDPVDPTEPTVAEPEDPLEGDDGPILPEEPILP